MARLELGEKRHCLSCETKYYDLNKKPIVCPKCSVVFEVRTQEKPEPEIKTKPEVKKETTDDAVVANSPEFVSLEDADDDDGETVDGEEIPTDIPDVEVENDDSETETDGPFLDQDDDDNDDVSNIITVKKDNQEDT